MNNKKGNKKNNIFKKIILGGLLTLGMTGSIYLLVPQLYTLFMNLLGLSVNILSIALIGSACVGVVIAIGLATKCIEVKTEYEFTNTDDVYQNPDMMREQLRIVKSDKMIQDERKVDIPNKYSYVFDNNYYTDTEELVIDDITYPREMMVIDESYSKKRTKYRGKYLR